MRKYFELTKREKDEVSLNCPDDMQPLIITRSFFLENQIYKSIVKFIKSLNKDNGKAGLNVVYAKTDINSYRNFYNTIVYATPECKALFVENYLKFAKTKLNSEWGQENLEVLMFDKDNNVKNIMYIPLVEVDEQNKDMLIELLKEKYSSLVFSIYNLEDKSLICYFPDKSAKKVASKFLTEKSHLEMLNFIKCNTDFETLHIDILGNVIGKIKGKIEKKEKQETTSARKRYVSSRYAKKHSQPKKIKTITNKDIRPTYKKEVFFEHNLDGEEETIAQRKKPVKTITYKDIRKETINPNYNGECVEKRKLAKYKCVKTKEYVDIREKDDKMFSGQIVPNVPIVINNNKVFTVTYKDVRKEQTKFNFNGVEQSKDGFEK